MSIVYDAAMNPIAAGAWKLFPFKSPIRRFRRSRASPGHWPRAARVCHTLAFGYGHFLSAARNEAVDQDGAPIPWYTYPALEYVRQLDFSSRTVFEYGCGNSTLFWSHLAQRVLSVEHDPQWYARMRAVLPENCEILLEEDPDRYVNAVAAKGVPFDVIVIDGQSRLRCAMAATRWLQKGGVILLDNSDWFPRTSEVLRTAGLLEVDMSGFGPINDYTSTTSLYFDRQFAFSPKSTRQPIPGIGSRPNSFDEAWWKAD
jgi:hypothetical protein